MNRSIAGLVLMAMACAAAPAVAAGQSNTAAVIDAAGRRVVAPKASPQRIVIGSGPLLHATLAIEGAAGEEDHGTSRIVAIGADARSRDKAGYALLAARYPALANTASAQFGEIEGLSPEAVAALKPDLAILSGTDSDPKPGSLAAVLIAAGVPVVLTDFRSHPGANSMTSLRAIAAALGRDADGNAFVRFYRDEIARVTRVTAGLAASDRPRAFLDMRAAPEQPCCGTPGKGNYGELMEAAGATNIGGTIHDKPLGRADVAGIVAAKPDIYIAGSSNNGGVPLGRGSDADTAGAALTTLMRRRAGLETMPMMTNGRAFAVWHSFYTHPFNVVVVQAMAKHFHSERFGSLDPAATLDAAWRFVGIEAGGTYWVAQPD